MFKYIEHFFFNHLFININVSGVLKYLVLQIRSK
jgi:hypothetical protein